jgi:Dot/Icm secretion system protein IcmQ
MMGVQLINYMVEQEKLRDALEIGKKLKDILDNILTVGEWDSSLFLRNVAVKLRGLRDKIEKLCQTNEGKVAGISQDSTVRRKAPPGYIPVFILLYQVDSSNLPSWYSSIKNLSEYSVSRPAYKDESHIQEFIRTKTTGIEHNGYVIVNVKEQDFYQIEPQVDFLGHPLVSLKEGAVKLENIVEFIHANKSHYAIRDNELVYLDKI